MKIFVSARAAKLFCVSCYSTKIYPTLTTGVKRLQKRQMTMMKADFFSKATKSRSFDFLFSNTGAGALGVTTPLTHKETTTHEQNNKIVN